MLLLGHRNDASPRIERLVSPICQAEMRHGEQPVIPQGEKDTA